ncbi:uncharacterized protein LOC111451473 isoform X1 [Cucurbita moschata]|uniref:Uncharacterized protein LOC111451473 isoform X1 n=1 Tax=Cucurbita moschata TaxID=3662 RepID=A0A6J1G7J3_CUCMO|nr:uncharacterized protein LOC111451473 isoform X1 [Cucurbita moschata]XP_022947679.1 uncharacterized protein LOC111451473 isoform X1 [Cucurbita moschata]
MAVGDLQVQGTGKKRKRGIERRLLVDENVEVRSLEDGFLGSWHGGTVIACNNGVRHVKYHHLLLNDGSGFLVDVVSISASLDGVSSLIGKSNVRGYIRPIPPTVDFGKWPLPYGLCVDVYYQDAWWEGVVFDHEDGSVERRIFFPDLGDELLVGIETLRITQEWDEATGDWKIRGNWSFLELIDRCEKESYLPVSLKQIWYEVRAKVGFMKIGEWTSPMNDLWKELVMEVIDENLDVTLKEMLRLLEISYSLGSELGKTDVCINKNPLTDLVGFDATAITGEFVRNDMVINDFNQENAFDDRGLVMVEVHDHDGLNALLDSGPNSTNIHLAQEESKLDYKSKMKTSNDLGFSCHDEALSMLPKTSPSIASDADGLFGAGAINHQRLPIVLYQNVNKQLKCSGHGNPLKWEPLNATTLPDAALYPDAVSEYSLLNREKPTQALLENARKHLLYLGWKIECRTDKPIFRYTSPNGKCFYSLRQVCKLLEETSAQIPPSISKDEMRNMHDSCHVRLSSRVLEQRERSSSPNNCFETTLDGSDIVLGKPELLHRAVVDYYNLSRLGRNGRNGRKKMFEMQSKTRMHLLSLGWRFLVNNKGKGNRQRWYYTSPLGRSCASLSAACKICLDEEGIYSNTKFVGSPLRNVFIIQKAEGQLVRNEFYSPASNMDVQECSKPSSPIRTFSGESPRTSPSKDLVKFSHDKFRSTRKLRSMANLFDFSSNLLQSRHKLDGKAYESGIQTLRKKYVRRRIRSPGAVKQNLSRASASAGINKFSDDMEHSRSMRVSRSSKRALEVVTPCASHHNPRTVLSWLIDNNMVLPRTKVYYCRGKDRQPMAEGRISRGGIKCCCCQKVFTINGFGIHAGSTSSRSAANILFEDGKSLLECQKLCNKKIRDFQRETLDCGRDGFSKGENDYICSICQFGGTLILCDQCPSSFHQSCLGLKKVIGFVHRVAVVFVARMNFMNTTMLLTTLSSLVVSVNVNFLCADHVECLGIKGTQNFGSYSKTYWFCNKHCKEIHLGLQKLLGKSIQVGGDNLTWSLLKATNSDTHHFNPLHPETVTENQSKLNVALSVMHECFEPVRDHHTRRDIVEDVIFSRRSELKRLNFQGFYTVLLERNDELVSVAAVRVYGERVAEVPLVGTRFHYRRLGMCRILMNELEERLRELGVQRLVLPAVSSVLNAWTTSFGFSKMNDSERLEFLNFTFLDFQETTMCQKFLIKDTVVPSSLAGKSELHDDGNKNSNSSDNICGSSAITELHPAAQAEESSILSQGQLGISAGNNSDRSPNSEGMLKNHLQINTSHIEKFPTCLAGGYKHCEGLQESTHDYLKYYRRRSKLISC